MPFKIAIAGFQHETNSFSPAATTYDDFLKQDSWPGLTAGNEVIELFKPLNIPIGGFISAATDMRLVPILWTAAEPYGLVTNDAFERISKAICDGIANSGAIDGVYLDLHGAMVVEQFEDGEGELLRRIRQFVGETLPIVISLDFHANITPPLAELADAITVYRTYPHIDMAQTGARAYQLLRDILERDEKPYKAYRQIPYLIPLSSQHTGSSPCRELYQLIDEISAEQNCSLDLACGFPPADIEHCGPAIVAYGWDKTIVNEAVDKLYDAILSAESRFTDSLLSAQTATRQAITKARQQAPVVIADIQDNPGAGSSSDTTGLLRELVAQRAQGAVIAALSDPEATAAAHQAGVGAVINIGLGGKSGPSGEQPFAAAFVVEAVGDGKIPCHGAMMNGVEINAGPMALLRVDDPSCDVRIVVTSQRVQCLDQAIIRSVGVEPAEQAIIVLKSTVHFRADFEPISSDILLAVSPGANPCQLHKVPYNNLRNTIRLGPRGHTLQASG